MAKILIKNGNVWDGERFFYADILTENDKIIKIEENISDNADFIYDASGKIVSAGLVDAHTHMRNISWEEYAIDSTMSCIPFGVTAAADAGAMYGDKKLIETFLVKTKVFAGLDIEDNKPCIKRAEERLERYGDKATGVKVCFDVTTKQVRDISPLKEAVEFAQKRGLSLTVHSSNPPTSMAELVSVLRKGDILTHAYHGGKNNSSDDDFKCIEDAKKRGVIIDAGLAGNVHTDFKVFGDAIKKGAIPNVISTDITRYSAYKRGGRYGMTMCMSIAKQLGMTEEDIFRAVTSNPAKAIGVDCGYLAVGKCADAAVFEYIDEGFDLTDRAGNHIKSETGYRCVLTIANGEVVYRR